MTLGHEPDFARRPRDTGLMLEGRVARERRRRQRERRRLLLVVAAVAAGLIACGWFLWRTAPKPPESTAVASGAPAFTRAGDMPKSAPEPVRDPTPLFAAYRDVGLHVPIPPDELTEIAFHQASYSYAQRLVTQLPTYATDSAKNKRGTGRTAEQCEVNERGWLGGYVLRLWRARPGQPDTSADVGGLAGAPVLSPVTGEVILVRAYRLYGKHPDFEVHIRPTGHDELDVVLIHINKPEVARGDSVDGGVTRIGSVRQLSSKMRLQLSDYTRGPGDHTHVQVNRVKPGTTEPITKS